ncbi:iron-containing redox enzyme family protein [Frankia gtarii]|uniref:iron-containing redox enzyme family protein n=1 Tax=Frankia gtarii TaxID=2950102 RepID=UPI0021C152FA|nr:iron-containing redox enzyme family protein [Frankia gtarii]
MRQSNTHAPAAGPRDIYSVVVDPECSLPTAPLVAEVRERLRVVVGSPATLAELRARAADWSSVETRRFLALRKEITSNDAREVLVRRASLGCAPLSLVSGAWLQWLSNPSTSEDAIALRVLSLYAKDVGAGSPRAARGSAYLTMLRHLRLSEYAAPIARLPADGRIAEEAFVLPALLLLMSRKPVAFTPEIMGADLCLRTVGTLPALVMLREELGAVVDWTALDPGAAGQLGSPSCLEHCLDAVQPLLSSAGDRVTLGFAWALAELTAWTKSLYLELRQAFDPAFEMAELIRLRAREAAIYHHDFQLDGQSLSERFEQARHDPEPIMRALAASWLVRPGRADLSPLVNGLVAERGPMFRVFSPDDMRVLRRWIDSLPAAASRIAPAAPAAPPLSLSTLAAPVERGRAPKSVREAYYMLQTRLDTVELRHYALGYVHNWLERSRLKVRGGDVRLPEHWDAGGLRPWLLDQHDLHSAEYEEADEPLPSRAELIDYTIQLSPMTLIDGSWLTGFTDYSLASTEIGFSLFLTYWDELGNSELSLNHPVIYRELLAEMDIELPATGSPEFAHWSGFADASFDLPVYWLCISRFPQTFMSELLGLNLAIELSGVGGTYRHTQKAQRAHRFSTRFIDIHSTIDNVSTGHSAWAVDAIDTYLASISTSDGPEARALVWDRVRTGYAALTAGDLGL